jgi:tight adherence protein C
MELRAGKQRRNALKNLALRTDLEDVSSLVTLLIQTEKFGTSLAQALRVHSDSMRTKRFQKAEEIAAKLPVKLMFPLVLFIFPSIFVVILGPAAIRIFRTLFPALAGG